MEGSGSPGTGIALFRAGVLRQLAHRGRFNVVYRRTLRREVACTGIGLHCGRPVRLRLVPAPAEHGIRFVRTDVGVEIKATLAHIGSQDHATTLHRYGVSIGTVQPSTLT